MILWSICWICACDGTPVGFGEEDEGTLGADGELDTVLFVVLRLERQPSETIGIWEGGWAWVGPLTGFRTHVESDLTCEGFWERK